MQETETLSLPLQELITFLSNEYEPTASYLNATLKITTKELFNKLIEMFPIEGFTEEQLFQYLKDLGFVYHDIGEMTIEWLMIKKINVL